MQRAGRALKNFFRRSAVRWAGGYLALLAGAVGLVYYWRVFYSYSDGSPMGLRLTGLACLAVTAGFLLFWAVRRWVRRFETKAALAIFLCGVCFCFANPPMQAPDETSHFLRSWAVSMGRFDFDAQRGYPAEVDALMAAFPGAWVNGHTTFWVDTDQNGDVTGGGSSAGYAIQENQKGTLESLGGQFAEYHRLLAEGGAPEANEPLSFMVLPFLPQAAGIALARLAGLGALACFYAGRLLNLACYALLCWLALKNCKRYHTVFLAVMLLPLSLYMAASYSYDALLLGCYYLTASYYCADEIRTKDLAVFLAAFVMMNAVKPWISLLWLALPLILPRKAWKTPLRKWQLALAALAAALAMTVFMSWYGVTFRYNYPEIGRMLGDTVNQGRQLGFVLQNIPRTIAIFLGTLYENGLYLTKLGLFGMLDLDLPLVGLLSAVALAIGAALSVHEKSSLTPRSAVGLGALAVGYVGGVLGALYITYTPVGMGRVLGVQTRYLLPSFLMLAVLLSALLSHVLEPTLAGGNKAKKLALGIFCSFALLSAVLLGQHYFIGPVYLR